MKPNFVYIVVMSFENRIRRLDVFKKVPKDLSQGTNIGGALSLLTAASVIAFLVIQIYDYLNPDYTTIIMPMRPHFKTKMRYYSIELESILIFSSPNCLVSL